MTFLLHQPSGLLGTLVQAIWSATADAKPADIPGLIAPDAHAEFVFHLGTPYQMQRAGATRWETLPQAMLYAQRTACVRLRSRGAGGVVAFRTSAVVASLLLRQSLRELWDRPVALNEVLGTEADGLNARLIAADGHARFSLLERWLCQRLSPWDADDSERERLHAQLVWRSGGAPVGKLAAALGLSQRTLRRWMDGTTGLSPKQLELSGRILRSCAQLRERPDASITTIAHDLGFGDHAAFANAFHAHTALTPRAFRQEALVFYERGPC